MNDVAQFLLARLREQPPADVDARRMAVLDWQRAGTAECVGWQTYEIALRRLAARYADHPDFLEQWRINDASYDGSIVDTGDGCQSQWHQPDGDRGLIAP